MANHPNKENIRQAWLSGMPQRQISERFGVSRSTLQRWIGDGWKKANPAMAKALASEILESATELGSSEILKNALQSLSEDMNVAPVRSREGAAIAIARLIELQRKLHPLTMDELADVAVNTPGFSVEGFVLALRARVDRG